MPTRVIPKDIQTRISDQGGKAVILIVTDVDGEEFVIPLDPHTADDIGRDILAGALALNGALR